MKSTAIREWAALSSAGEISFVRAAGAASGSGTPQFVRQTAAAGCVGYFVLIAAKRVQYFGRGGRLHGVVSGGGKKVSQGERTRQDSNLQPSVPKTDALSN